MIIQEATAVERRGRISAQDLGIWEDAQLGGLKEIAAGIKESGAAAGIQLAHAGRKCGVQGEDVISPSPLIFSTSQPGFTSPREMTKEDMDNVLASFTLAAARALEAGYDLIEIHGAHGYLLNEFLSPLTNKRNDSYGGTAENRARFAGEVIRSVRSVWPADKALALRVSAEDFFEGGNTAPDVAGLINLVKSEGIDLIHVSTGGVVEKAVMKPYPGYQIPPASVIKRLTGLPVIGGGLITTAGEGNDIIKQEQADLVFYGRELLRNPFFPLLSARKAGVELSYWPRQYLRAR